MAESVHADDQTSTEAEIASAVDLDWSSAGTSSERGPEVIARFARTLPSAPGVYRMTNGDGDVLYVGKAKNLRARVTSYTRPQGQNNRIARMIRETASMEFVRTRSEAEALLLEANLIKRLKPRFNVLLRDDKSFPYILITADHEAPQIVKHRGSKTRKGSYYGPFANVGAVNRTVAALQKAFLLRTCTDSVYESRTRPCLLHQIKRCSGPCTGEVSLEDYAELTREANAFLSGRATGVQKTLAEQMENASTNLDFETAAIYRDRLSALSLVQSRQGANTHAVDEADVFAVADEGGQFCIQVFFFRMGQNWGNRAYYPRADKEHDEAQVLAAFLAQFYDDKPVPTEILLSHEPEDQALLATAFAERAGRRVNLLVPKRGQKRDLVSSALVNAREALGRKLAETSSQARLMEGLARVFELPAPPHRVEVYDNSHIMGTNAVGAMVVAGPEGFSKTHYRKFNIRDDELTPGDDFAMMREVMRRRFSRLLKEAGPREAATNGDGIGPWPDLVLIDGGKGQLSSVMEVLTELRLEALPVVSVAKGRDRDAGRETFHRPGKPPLTLPPRDPVLYFIQRLRDEAHRFAIGSHRARRKKEMVTSPLDEIAGIGPTRKRALLQHFGSAKGVSRAGVEDLQQVDGISASMARAIYGHFHEGAAG